MKCKVHREWAVGERHGHWTVTERIKSGTKDDDRDRFIKVLCDCGTVRTVAVISLGGKRNTHCGCVNGKKDKEYLKYVSEYNSWRMMKERCGNPKRRDYRSYGGRGITVCERWVNDFSAFYEDMGQKPALLYSLDRIDVNGNYCPENCRWATPAEQMQNRRPLPRKKKND